MKSFHVAYDLMVNQGIKVYQRWQMHDVVRLVLGCGMIQFRLSHRRLDEQDYRIPLDKGIAVLRAPLTNGHLLGKGERF